MAQDTSPTDIIQNAPKLRTGGRSQQIGERVEQAVMEQLEEGGASSLTFDAIAKRADINRATLRRRWGDKWRLVTWVLYEVMLREAPSPDTGTFRGDLRATMLNLNSAFSNSASGAFIQVLFVEARSDSAIALVVKEYWNRRLELFRPIFERAVVRDELPADANFDFVLDLVYGPFFYHLLRTNAPITEAYADAIIDAALTIVAARDLNVLNPVAVSDP